MTRTVALGGPDRLTAPDIPTRGWWLAAAAGALWGATVAFTPPLVSVGVGLLVLLWLATFKWPALALAAVLVLYFVPLTQLDFGTEALPVDVRILSAPFLLAFLRRRWHQRPFPRGAVLAVAAVALAVWLSLFGSRAPEASVEAAVGMLLGAATAVLGARALPYTQILAVVRNLCAAAVVVSVALVPFWAEAILAGRLRGVLANPNGLGLLIVLLVPLLVARYGWRSPVLWIAFAALPFTGSRASAAALTAGLAVWTWVRADRRSRRTLFPCFLITAVVLAVLALNDAVFTSSSPTSLFRSADSRTVHWRHALQVADTSAWTGYGFGAFPAEVSNSYLLALVEFGPLTILTLGATAAVTVMALRSRRMEVPAFAVGGLCNAAFESWLLAGGSLYFVAFWTVMAAAALQRPPEAAEP